MPDSPGVNPPGVNSSMAFKIFSFSAPDTPFNFKPTTPPYTTIETVSCTRRLFTSILKADCNNGSRLGRSIEPETSIRKTKLLGGNFSRSNFLEFIFTNNSWLSWFQGQLVTTDLVINKFPSSGLQ